MIRVPGGIFNTAVLKKKFDVAGVHPPLITCFRETSHPASLPAPARSRAATTHPAPVPRGQHTRQRRLYAAEAEATAKKIPTRLSETHLRDSALMSAGNDA